MQAEIRTSFEDLYRMMSQREEFRWMMLRIKRMAEPWVGAIRSLAAKQNLATRRRKKVCVKEGGCAQFLFFHFRRGFDIATRDSM